jgi:predicted transcriptional regulator
MAERREQAVTIRMDSDLHENASAISRVTREPLRKLVEDGLRREVADRLGDERLAEAVRAVRGYTRAVET